MDSGVEYPGVQLSWRRILAIAEDQPDPIVAKGVLPDDSDDDEEYQQEQTTFNRMQCMNKALQDIYIITRQGEISHAVRDQPVLTQLCGKIKATWHSWRPWPLN